MALVKPDMDKERMPKPTNEEILRRRAKALEYVLKMRSEHKRPLARNIQEHLKNNGWPKCTLSQAQEDLTQLNRGDTFLIQLFTNEYSSRVRQIFESLDDLESEAWDDARHDHKYTRAQARKIILEINRTRLDIFNSKIIDLSAEMLGRKLAKALDDLEKYKQKETPPLPVIESKTEPNA